MVINQKLKDLEPENQILHCLYFLWNHPDTSSPPFINCHLLLGTQKYHWLYSLLEARQFSRLSEIRLNYNPKSIQISGICSKIFQEYAQITWISVRIILEFKDTCLWIQECIIFEFKDTCLWIQGCIKEYKKVTKSKK